MKPGTVLLISGVITTSFSILQVDPTAFTLGTFGVEAHADGLLLGRDQATAFLALTVLNVLGRNAEGEGLKAILLANIFFQAGEVILNLIEVLLEAAPATVLPGKSSRVVLVVLFWLAYRESPRNPASAPVTP